MPESTPLPKDRIASTYNAASDRYDDPALSYWHSYGGLAAERARLQAEGVVLDVGSGSGASAIPAARMVGPAGRVIGLDLSEGLIALARAKAAAEDLGNVEFRLADFEQAYFRNASFDAVLSCFSIFFFPDMSGTLRKMWRLLRPGGRMVVVTWAKDTFEPADTAFWHALREIRPEEEWPVSSWKRMSEPADIHGAFAAAGIEMAELETEDRDHVLRTPDDWWTIVMGSGYRGMVEQLSAAERERLRSMCLSHRFLSIHVPAHLAVAVKS